VPKTAAGSRKTSNTALLPIAKSSEAVANKIKAPQEEALSQFGKSFEDFGSPIPRFLDIGSGVNLLLSQQVRL
jgi:hypothetical protein